MTDNELFIGGKYLFLDWYRKRIGELEPIVEVEVIEIIPEHRSGYLLKATSYTAIDKQGVYHYGSAVSFRPLNWTDDRKVDTL
jgi:hypothetical protein